MENKIMLITYADSMGKDLKDLNNVLNNHFKDTIGSVHILPFYPSSADRGFAPMTYTEVDEVFGDWKDILKISENYELMYDFMINHISRSSKYFQDFLKNKDESSYSDLFIRYKDFWKNGEPTEEQVDKIYKRKPRAPYVIATFEDGSKEKVWCTFDEEQIDLDVTTDTTKQFVIDNLSFLAKHGANFIRLDAFAYAIKKPDTSCFFIEPGVWELLDECQAILKPMGVEMLPEIHEHYTIQLNMAKKGCWVYDFALPMLVLYSLFSGKNNRLINWLNICPRKQFTTLDTHDGIGVVDVVDLMTDKEIDYTKEVLYKKGANVKKKYSSAEYKNLDIYQINCTYYSALGNNDAAYLLARAIQFFAPGIPQVYYVGLLAGENDLELLEKTKVGRNINRHYYTVDEINERVTDPMLQNMYKLMEFRNTYDAFNGDVTIVKPILENELVIVWEKGELKTTLIADLKTHEFKVMYVNEAIQEVELDLT
ncbi:sucrose phosphorylase [Haloplasma contractile]|uniref:Dextransucrase Sucrose 6-glucosyltransferase protein n=1 Tax=Haloplasma contractile SSD-17B TaxID=1033810 RepID=U2DTP3_9MOLU|nr:Dextransucrase Sucrose 6-glucosyltransferase protein [Haloplasma contractile SSD-17B]